MKNFAKKIFLTSPTLQKSTKETCMASTSFGIYEDWLFTNSYFRLKFFVSRPFQSIFKKEKDYSKWMNKTKANKNKKNVFAIIFCIHNHCSNPCWDLRRNSRHRQSCNPDRWLRRRKIHLRPKVVSYILKIRQNWLKSWTCSERRNFRTRGKKCVKIYQRIFFRENETGQL